MTYQECYNAILNINNQLRYTTDPNQYNQLAGQLRYFQTELAKFQQQQYIAPQQPVYHQGYQPQVYQPPVQQYNQFGSIATPVSQQYVQQPVNKNYNASSRFGSRTSETTNTTTVNYPKYSGTSHQEPTQPVVTQIALPGNKFKLLCDAGLSCNKKMIGSEVYQWEVIGVNTSKSTLTLGNSDFDKINNLNDIYLDLKKYDIFANNVFLLNILNKTYIKTYRTFNQDYKKNFEKKKESAQDVTKFLIESVSSVQNLNSWIDYKYTNILNGLLANGTDSVLTIDSILEDWDELLSMVEKEANVETKKALSEVIKSIVYVLNDLSLNILKGTTYKDAGEDLEKKESKVNNLSVLELSYHTPTIFITDHSYGDLISLQLANDESLYIRKDSFETLYNIITTSYEKITAGKETPVLLNPLTLAVINNRYSIDYYVVYKTLNEQYTITKKK